MEDLQHAEATVAALAAEAAALVARRLNTETVQGGAAMRIVRLPLPPDTSPAAFRARLMAAAALAREESRGSHFRSDFPEPASEARHSWAVGDSIA